MSNELEMIAYGHIEITMRDFLTEQESHEIIIEAERHGINAVVNQQGRIIVFECDDMEEPIRIICDMQLAEMIGLIKIVTELEPQWDVEFI